MAAELASGIAEAGAEAAAVPRAPAEVAPGAPAQHAELQAEQAAVDEGAADDEGDEGCAAHPFVLAAQLLPVMEVKHGCGYSIPAGGATESHSCLPSAQQAYPAHRSCLSLTVAGRVGCV